MRNEMSTVSMVGCEPATISGTDSTLSMMTKDRINPTIRVGATSGSTISMRQRSRDAPRLRAASMVARSSAAMPPASSKATNGACFHTKVTMMPRQSSRLTVWSGSKRPLITRVLFNMPFLARNVRMHWAATTNGINSGQR